MRVGIGLVAAAFVLFFGAPGHASASFPDLPGMGSVAKVTHNQAPSTTRSVSASSTSNTKQTTSDVGSAAQTQIKRDKVEPILKLPGSGALPIINNFAKTSERTKTALPDALFVLAGIGTATSLGMLWAVRRRYDRPSA